MKSNRKIKQQAGRKRNQKLAETVAFAKKSEFWKEVADKISAPRNKMKNLNLGEIGKKISEGKSAVISGKVLSQGEIGKKVKIIALNFSEKAKEKLLKTGCEISNILEEIKKNPDGKGLEILK